MIVIITVSFFHLYTKFTMSSSNNTIAPPRLVRSGSSAHYAIAPSPLRRADSRHVQSVPFGLTRSYSNAPPLMRTESGEVQCFDEPFDESNHGGSAIDGGTVDLATDWFPRDDSTQITPLHISNAQSASPRSLITAPEGGVLNVQRCNMHEPLHGGRVTRNAVYQGADLNGCGYGAGTIAFDDGATYYGEWTNDRFHGNGIFSAGNHPRFAGRTYNGVWRTEDTQLYGEGTISFPDGSLYSGGWMNGYRHGYGTYTDASGGLMYAGVWFEDRPACQT